ncbi:hypothetical protein SAMN02799631_06506 [Methylobacterium sp. 174MFSha1.1]|uniref:hypothetical protein n=1 Tax=Methylobacterium sp. 174MFSha1.1 TaxID=1502749 RepID=UPI0008EA46B0|nr:hypothetical protein [Methylobacterium sp. 174MFSha1.1]SFV16718.1 hypothetical protein SAMN02799631_06506 [Methylobacterium sp. 174MFSha1.1]
MVKKQLIHLWNLKNRSRDYIPAKKFLSYTQQEVEKINKGHFNYPIYNWMLIIDEYILTFSNCYMSYNQDNSKLSKQDLVLKIMIGALAGHLNAVKSLTLAGFDIQAKILARMISEHVDLIISMKFNPDLCEEFHAAANDGTENTFWNKKVSKRKLRAGIKTAVELQHPDLIDAWKDINTYVTTEEEILGKTVHPSYIASALVNFSGPSLGGGGLGFFGLIGPWSSNTLQFINCRIFEMLLLCKDNITRSVLDNFDVKSPVPKSDIVDTVDYISLVSFCFLWIGPHIRDLNFEFEDETIEN